MVQSDRSRTTKQYGDRPLHAEYLRLRTNPQNKKYLFLFHSNNGYANAPQCYVYMNVHSPPL